MSRVRTYGRRPTLGEVKEYYSREDVLEFLSYSCRKRKVSLSFRAEPSFNSESGAPPLEPESVGHLHQIVAEGMEANLRGMADDVRPSVYPSFHGMTSKDGDVISDFVMEADCQGWRRSFVDVRGAIEILNDFGVPYIAKFSGHRSLHVMIPREAFPEEFDGRTIARSWKSLEKRLRSFFRTIALVRYAHGTGGILRLPYSLNENTGMVSLPIGHEGIDDFRPWEAIPHLVTDISSGLLDVSEDSRNRTSQFLQAALIEKQIKPLEGRMWRIQPKGDLDRYRHFVDDPSSIPTKLGSDDPVQRAEAAWKLMVSGAQVSDEIISLYMRERSADVRWFIAEALTGDERISELLRETDEYAADAVSDSISPIVIPFLRRLLSKSIDWEPSATAMMNIRSVFERSSDMIEDEIIRQAEIVDEAKAPVLLKCASLTGAASGSWRTLSDVADLLERRFPGMEEVVSRDVFDNVRILLETDGWGDPHKQAAEALIAAGKHATDALIMAMASGDHWTRRTVISILGRIGDPKALPCIVDALGDPGRKIRNMAVSGVVKLGRGSEEAKKLLIEAAESDNPRLRANAIRVLRLIGDKTSEPLEIALKSLEDMDPKVRQAGIKSLGKIGGRRAIDGLQRALADEDRDVIINAAFALSDMGDEGEEVLKAALQEDNVQIARCAAHALVELGNTSAIHLVIDAFNDNGWEMWFTPFTLAASGDRRAVETLMRYVESSLDMADVSSKAVQAVRALGNCTDERAVEMLKTVMYKRRDRKPRRAAIMALQNMGTEKAVDVLLEALASEDGNLRQHARNALMKTGPEILPRLRTLAEQVEGKPRRSVESLLQAMMQEPQNN